MNEETSEKKPRLTSASRSSLPQSSVIPDSETFKQVNGLLKRAVALRAKISEQTEDLDEIKATLASIAAIYELKGFRHGLCGFEYRGYTSRQSLNRQKLVERMSAYGAPASLIDECYEDGKPFLETRVVAFDLE